MINLGLGICSSFCTVRDLIPVYKKLAEEYEVYPFMSQFLYDTDTRFGTAYSLKVELEKIFNRQIVTKITEIEPYGPKDVFDVLLIAPLTGNTLSKLANGITDNAITSITKAHLRNNKPLILSMSTNDGLGGNFENIAKLYNRKNIYIVPFYEDDIINKPNSLMSDRDKIIPCVEGAIKNKQMQPLFSNCNSNLT